MNALADQKRSDVRVDISCIVNFKFITSEEYESSKNCVSSTFYPAYKTLKINGVGTDNHDEIAANSQMVEFLVQMDEKLNLILSMLSEKDLIKEETFEQGNGVNISGSGMRMMVDRPLCQPIEIGQILYLDFKLSLCPYIHVRSHGKVIRMTPLKKENGVTYDLGIHFLDLDDCIRDQIFSKVFQLQREAIRKERQNL